MAGCRCGSGPTTRASFRVQARLVLILDGKVRLLKETGRTTTVPIERLSPDDRAYVDAIITRYGKDLASLLLVAR